MARFDEEYPELAREWDFEKNGDLSPRDFKSGSHEKVWWKCTRGHSWQVSINSRVYYHTGCPICSGKKVLVGFNDLATVNPELAAQWHPTQNGDLTPKDVTAKSGKKIWWVCHEGHEWQTTVSDRSRGHNCPYCAGLKTITKTNDLATLNPKLAAEWHPTKNGSLSPDQLKPGSNKKVWWRCDKGHEWEATVESRTAGSGCPYCSGRTVLAGFNDLATVNPELTAQWHPAKNADLTPNQVTAGSKRKVWWQCDKGHEWQATVESRNAGSGCPYCSGRRVLVGFNDLATVNPELTAQWHPTKNEDLHPTSVTAGSKRKVWWQCDQGHNWEATVGSRTAGNGCPYCAGKKVWPGFNDLATLRPDLAEQWHPTKNGTLTPRDVTVGTKKKVWWQCDKGHEWEATIDNRNHGYGCPECAYERQTSFPEQAIFYYLSQVLHAVNRFKVDEKYEADIFIPETKTAIEYDGLRWHKGAESEAKDSRKNVSFKKGGTRLIRVKEVARNEQLPTDTQDVIYCSNPDRGSNLSKVIDKLLERLGISAHIDVDINRDAAAIYSQYTTMEKDGSLLSLRPDLASEWHPTKNGNLLPQQVTPNSHKRVWWRCDKGHEWQAVVESRNEGNACPYCSNKKVLSGFNDLATTNTELAAQWHPAKNDDLTPNQVTAGSGKRVWWQCDKGHEWQATVSSRKNGAECPFCSGKRVKAGFNDLATLNPGLAAQWHPTKNGALTPEQFMPGSVKKVWWQCDKGHEWEATIGSRNQGRGCPYCSGRKTLVGFNDLATLSPNIAKQWHPLKNGDLKPEDVTLSSGKKVWWQCDKGHEWQATIESRTAGSSCPYCSGRKVWSGFNDLATLNPQLASEWHPTKNGELTPKDVRPGSKKKVWWKCGQGHTWQATVANRSRGSNCPSCRNQN